MSCVGTFYWLSVFCYNQQNGCKCMAVYSYDRVANWELWLTAAAWRLGRVLSHILIAQEKTKILSIVLLYDYHFCTKVKKL